MTQTKLTRATKVHEAFVKMTAIGETITALRAEINAEGKLSQGERDKRRLDQQRPIWVATDELIVYLHQNFGGDEEAIKAGGREGDLVSSAAKAWIKLHRDLPFDAQVMALEDASDATVNVWIIKQLLSVYRAPLNPAKMQKFNDFAVIYKDIIL